MKTYDKYWITEEPKLKVGDTVFFAATQQVTWIEPIRKCTIKEIFQEDNMAKVSFERCGVAVVPMDLCFLKKEDAEKCLQEHRFKRISSYKESIQTVEDLVSFAYNNCLCGEEYADYDARQAYQERTMELLGIDLDNPLSKENKNEYERE